MKTSVNQSSIVGKSNFSGALIVVKMASLTSLRGLWQWLCVSFLTDLIVTFRAWCRRWHPVHFLIDVATVVIDGCSCALRQDFLLDMIFEEMMFSDQVLLIIL